MKKQIISYIGLLLAVLPVEAQMLTLDDCRGYALKAVSTQAGDELRQAADYNRQAATAAMFPKITANAAYTWNSQHAVLQPNGFLVWYGHGRQRRFGIIPMERRFGNKPIGTTSTADTGGKQTNVGIAK